MEENTFHPKNWVEPLISNCLIGARTSDSLILGSAAVVLGMFRSGTSMVGNILSELGAFIENNMFPPDRYNEKGYWESAELSGINEGILGSVGFNEFRPPPLFSGWEGSETLVPYKAKVSSYVGRMDTHGLWACKNPATTLTLPFLRPYLPKERHFLIIVRNPLAVSKSISRWSSIPDAYFSSRLWAAYTLSALANTVNESRLLLFYEDFLTDAELEVKRIEDFLGLKGSRNPAAVFSRSLDHHTTSNDELLGSRMVPWGAKLLNFVLRESKNNPEILDLLTEEILEAGKTGPVPIWAKGEDDLAYVRRLKASYDSLRNHPFVKLGRKIKVLNQGQEFSGGRVQRRDKTPNDNGRAHLRTSPNEESEN